MILDEVWSNLIPTVIVLFLNNVQKKIIRNVYLQLADSISRSVCWLVHNLKKSQFSFMTPCGGGNKSQM